MSIRLRLTVWYTLLFGGVLLVLASLVYVVVSRQLKSQLDYALHLQALDASQAAHGIALPSQVGAGEPLYLPSTVFDGRRLYVQLVDPRGLLLATSNNLAQPLPATPARLRPALDGGEDHVMLDLPRERVDLHGAPLLLDGKLIGVLQVAASLTPLENDLRSLRLVLGGVVLAAVGAGVAVGWLIASSAMRPVDAITRTAHAIRSSTDLARRLPQPRRQDELGRLATTFNTMLAQLEQAFGTQRRFVADASHELRSPLASIRINVESLLRDRSPEASERDATLQAVARETDRLGRLVDGLLVLARSDAGQALYREPLALDTVLLEAYQQAKPLATDVRLSLGDFEPVELSGDRDRLKQVVLNLLDNALCHTPVGGCVTLNLARCGGWAVLTVRDTGTGIPANHLPHIFERFYRVDRPRTRSSGGAGLGLAICRSIVEAHGGRIEVTSTLGAGSSFVVWLPASIEQH